MGRVFNYKLGCFNDVNVFVYVDARPDLQLKLGPGLVLLAKVCPWTGLKMVNYSNLFYEVNFQVILLPYTHSNATVKNFDDLVS
jgi:hypothetical protein